MIIYTTEAYARKTGNTPENIRQMCRRGAITAASKIAGAGHGIWIIQEGAEIKLKKRGRKLGWRKNKIDNINLIKGGE